MGAWIGGAGGAVAAGGSGRMCTGGGEVRTGIMSGAGRGGAGRCLGGLGALRLGALGEETGSACLGVGGEGAICAIW